MQLPSRISAASPAGLGNAPAYPDPFWRAGTLGDVAVLDVAASPAYEQDHTLFAVTADTLYRTRNRGNSWQALPVSFLADGRFGRIAVSPGYATDHTLFATHYTPGTNTTAVLRSWDSGAVWQLISTLTDEVRVLRLSPGFLDDHTVFALAGAGTDLLRSMDGGESWQSFPFDSEDIFNTVDLAVSPDYVTDRTLFVTGLGDVSRSTDGGESWISQNRRAGPTYAVAISPVYSLDGTVWESYRLMEGIGDGTPESGIIRSTDRGESWHFAYNGLPDNYEPWPRSIAVSPNYAADQTLFTALGGQIVSGLDRSLFRSVDKGANWTDLGSAPGNPDIYRMVATYSRYTGLTAHLATEHGIWHYGDPMDRFPFRTFLPLLLRSWPLPTPTPTATQTPVVTNTPTATPSATRTPTVTPTSPVSVTPSATPTLTPTATPTSQPPVGCYAGFRNPGFESDEAWEIRPNPVLAAYVTSPVHGGSRSMRTGIPAGGANTASYSPIQQAVAFPAGLASAQMRFWRYSVWGDGVANAAEGTAPSLVDLPRTLAEMEVAPAAPAVDDYFYVLAILPDGAIDWLLVERVNSALWREGVVNLDVARYAGKSIRFQFGTYNNGTGGISRTFVDDAALTLCPPAGALVLSAGWADRVIGRAELGTIYADVDGALYRSNDAGLTWALSGTARPEPMILTADPDVLYAGNGYPCYAGGDPVPMWRTVNGGASWQQVAAGVNLKPLAAHPTNVNRLFAAGCDGPYLTTDGGASFVRRSGELFNLYDAKFIAPVGLDWTTVWVGGISEGGGGAVLVSRDGGVSWTHSTFATQPQIGWFGGLAVDAFRSGVVYAPAVDGFRTTSDNGANWVQNSEGLADVTDLGSGGRLAGIFGLAQDPAGDHRLFMGTVKGLYARDPATTIWYKLSGQPYDQLQINSLLALFPAPQTLYLNSVNGVFRYNLGATPPGPTRTPTPTPPVAGSPTPTATPTATSLPTPIPMVTPYAWPTPFLAGSMTFNFPARPNGLALNATGAQLYVALHGEDHSGRSVAVMATGPLQVSWLFTYTQSAAGPNQVARLPDGKLVVSNRQTDDATILDVSAATIPAAISANLLPNGVAAAGNYGYIANFGNDTVTVFDPATFAVIRTLYNVGHQPSLFAADPNGSDVFLSAHGSDEVIHLRDGSTVGRWQGVKEPYGLAYDPAGKRLYAANRGTNHTVTVIDVEHNQILGTIGLDKEPFVLGVNPDSGHLFIACSTEVKVYRAVDWSSVVVIPVAAGAEEGIIVDSIHDRVYVTSRDGNGVSMIQDVWPPQVLFTKNRQGAANLYAMWPDATHVKRLTDNSGAVEMEAVGSPDGRWIAFTRWSAEQGFTKLWVMSRDGLAAHALTTGNYTDGGPTWSPDGTKLAFASDRDGDMEIYVMALTPSMTAGAVTQLTDNSAFDYAPDWGRANNRIVFQSNRVGPNSEIFDMRADGTDVRRLTVNANGDADPSWAADGLRIAFWGTRDQQTLYTMNADGSNIQPLIPQSPYRANSPAWGPPGSMGEILIFGGYRPESGFNEIFRVRSDGAEIRLLTMNVAEWDSGPRWLPGREG